MENKKQKKLSPDLIILICVTAVVLACVICHPAFNAVTNRLFHEYIVADQVEKIGAPGGPLNEEETQKFIKLFNTASYKGKDIGYGTTPELGFTATFRDGSKLYVQDYGGDIFVVFRVTNDPYANKNQYFVESKQLRQFMEELAAKEAA